MKERGSRKNRFRVWFFNLKRKKKKKHDESVDKKKQKEQKQYNKLQVFLITCFGLFIGLFEGKTKEEKKNSDFKKEIIVKIKVQLTAIEKKNEKLIQKVSTVKEKKEIAEIKKEIAELRVEQQNIKQTIKEEKIEVKSKEKQEVLSEVEVTLKKELEQLDNHTNEVEQLIIDLEEKIEQKELKIEDEIVTNKKKGVANLTEQEEYKILKNYLKDANYEMNKVEQLLQECQKIDTLSDINFATSKIDYLLGLLAGLELDESSMRKKINFSRYQKDEDLKNLDQFSFLSKENRFHDWTNKCQLKLSELENKKQEILKEQKIEKFKNEEKKVDAFKLDKIKIKEDVYKQKLMIKKLEKSLKTLKPHQRKKGRLARLGTLIKNTLFVNLGIFSIFKTKGSVFGLLGGFLLTNHGIRGMRNMTKERTKDVPYYNVEQILTEMQNEKDVLTMSVYLCKDSLEQLQKLKFEFLEEYRNSNDYQVLAFKEQLLQLEQDLISQEQELELQQMLIEEEYQKGKQKIKTLNERGNIYE